MSNIISLSNSIFANMASGVPSFAKPSAKYEKMFSDDNEGIALIAATPVSKFFNLASTMQ